MRAKLRTRAYAILGMVVWKVGKRYARRRIGRLRPGRPNARLRRGSAHA